MSLMMVVTALGWFGALAGLVAYAMVSRGRWSADSLAFQSTNVLAAGTLLTVAAVNGIWPSAASNVAAIVIGANALFTVFRAKRRAAGEAAALSVVEAAAEPLPAETAERPAVPQRVYAEAA
ncbi:hypothetical protein ACFQHV_18850 [Promicromonospora thailandica]|uniref:CBU-0592-like domain-containing protein n=1 Tax=Promicromonospora thailandica TaxID=765201 RepID=A0A9X2G489_9MICO|nr:hypothetical protein [Promicromonospora thailandica]MCP2265258.1 hypothetical protein [Promicromonospora thailandica]BFF19652.1 hypothetical protein GCM10025730_31730 [Promicromonospora thailandica]